MNKNQGPVLKKISFAILPNRYVPYAYLQRGVVFTQGINRERERERAEHSKFYPVCARGGDKTSRSPSCDRPPMAPRQEGSDRSSRGVPRSPEATVIRPSEGRARARSCTQFIPRGHLARLAYLSPRRPKPLCTVDVAFSRPHRRRVTRRVVRPEEFVHGTATTTSTWRAIDFHGENDYVVSRARAVRTARKPTGPTPRRLRVPVQGKSIWPRLPRSSRDYRNTYIIHRSARVTSTDRSGRPMSSV